jgi:hypothetical protein
VLKKTFLVQTLVPGEYDLCQVMQQQHTYCSSHLSGQGKNNQEGLQAMKDAYTILSPKKWTSTMQ